MRNVPLIITRIILTRRLHIIARLSYFLVVVLAGTTAVSAAANPAAAFSGSAQCVRCHEEIYTDWQQSDHHKAMQAASKATVLGDFNNVTVSFHGIDTRLFENDGTYQVATAGKDGEPGVYTIKYTFGHYPLQQYLIDIGKGHFILDKAMKFELRIAFETDIDLVRKIIKQIGVDMFEDPQFGSLMLAPLKSQGVNRMDDSALIIRCKFTALPGQQYLIRREAFTRIQRAFEEKGTQFAPRRVLVESVSPDEAIKAGGALLDQEAGAQNPSKDNL